jgi:hydrophobic/amphiphilic exporter-1 (mainly G- bacteria), HAE1 family
MSLASFAIRRPVLITMIVLALVILGIIGYSRLGMDTFPNMKIPYITVAVTYSGAGPREVETKVTKVIEDAVATASNIKQIQSTASEGLSTTIIEFQVGTDPDIAAQDIRDRVSQTRGNLPADIDEPVISKLDINAMAIMNIAVSGDMSLSKLRHLADDTIKSRLERATGVASATVSGGVEREIQVLVDADRLQAYNLDIGQVVSALAAANLNVPAGHIDEIGRRYTVRIPGEFENVAQIQQVLLPVADGAIHLSDVAQIKDNYKERENYARLNGKECVTISVQKLSEANIVQTANAVKTAVAELNRTLQGQAHLVVAFDSSTFAKDSISDVTNNLFFGGLLAVIVVFFFLGSLRGTLISAIALPTSVISAFGLMYFSGFTLNMMSMMALALAIGMLIDDAIVVIENIHRHLEEAETPDAAAAKGTGEIAAAVTAITLTIIAVFAPIAFMSGIAGRIFREFGLTVIFAVLVSLLVSLTLTPMLAARLLRAAPVMRGEHKRNILDIFNAGYERLEESYRPLLRWSLRHRKAVVITSLVIFLASLGLMKFLPTEFVPATDRAEVSLSLKLPAGTALAETNRVSRQIEKMLRAKPEVLRVLATVGNTGQGSGLRSGATGADTATIKVKLVPKNRRKMNTQEFMESMRQELKDLPGLTFAVLQPGIIGDSASSPVEITFQGPEVNQLIVIAKEAKQRLAGISGLTDLDISLRPGQPEAQVQVDRVKATNLGLSVAKVANTLRTAVDGAVASQYREGGDEYDIRVQLKKKDRQEVAQLENLRVANDNGELLPLSDVTQLVSAEGPSQITRTDKIRTVTITGSLLEGYALGNIVKESQKTISGMTLPEGYSVRYTGEAERMGDMFGSILFALVLAVIFVYMILAAQFESFVHPFTIGLSLPLALVGAVVALLLAGSTMNMMSMIGIVMLMGLVTKNAILLVDYTNTLRKRGLARDDAILRAGPVRLRPILMTTTAMVFGMLPVALGIGAGSEMRAPMAICVIGGLLSSMFLTLVLVPVVYTLMDDLSHRFRRAKQ